MSIAIDEYGTPIFLLADQNKKKRLKGLEAQKSNILACISLARTLKTSLGPKGMDKIICSADGDVTVTNDGATILSKMEVNHPCAKLLVDLSTSQDDEIGDGTTGVVVLAGALLDQALSLLEKGLHPRRISDGYDHAQRIAQDVLESLAIDQKFSTKDHEALVLTAMTALGSKVVSSCQRQLSELAVQAVLSVADLDRRDVNFDMIKVDGKAGGKLEDSYLVHGIVLDKEFSHPSMIHEITDAKIALLTCPFEPPKPKTKHRLEIQNVEDYWKLRDAEVDYFKGMIQAVKKSGANMVICQWGFDDEANHLLMTADIPAVRWVGGVELELIAIATEGRIISRFEDLSPSKLGYAKHVKQVSVGTENEHIILIEGCKQSKSVTALINGGNNMIVEEAKRCFHDAVCCVRNLIKCSQVVPGGGASEIEAAVVIEQKASTMPEEIADAVQAYSNALLAIPEALADNCGMDAVSTVYNIRTAHFKKEQYIGLDCMECVPGHMIERNIWELLSSKISQFSLATQVVRMILKIDEVFLPNETQDD